MIRRGHLDVPVIGVARGASLHALRERARESLEHHPKGLDPAAFARLMELMRFVEGNYEDPATFDRVRDALGGAKAPLFYLAIPPSLFPVVVRGARPHRLQPSGARVVVEKPFGRDLASARALNATLHTVFDEKRIFRIDHYLGKEPVQNILYFRFANTFLEPIWNRHYVQQRADHDGRAVRRRRPRPLLRGSRRDPRRHPESHPEHARAFSRWSRRCSTTRSRSTTSR